MTLLIVNAYAITMCNEYVMECPLLDLSLWTWVLYALEVCDTHRTVYPHIHYRKGLTSLTPVILRPVTYSLHIYLKLIMLA